MKIYLVGGAVRDLLMGLEPKDKDYVVVGATPQQMLDMGYSQVGASFPVFLHPDTGDEYALARTERKTGVGYNGFDVVFDPTITLEQDLIRRDLTINSMAKDLTTGEIIDPYGGRQDLIERTLRHTSEAFAEDPVRVLRTARFAARYGFAVADDTIELMRSIVREIDAVPAERVFAEFAKGLMEAYPNEMYDVLKAAQADKSAHVAPYLSGWVKADIDRLQEHHSMIPRFAVIAGGFNAAAYDKLRIPVELSRVAKAVWKTRLDIAGHSLLSDAKFLDVCEQLRAFSDAMLLPQVVEAVEVLQPGFDADAFYQRIDSARINAAAIAASCKSGAEIKSAIRSARLAAMAPAKG